jgi:hypothetical protein
LSEVRRQNSGVRRKAEVVTAEGMESYWVIMTGYLCLTGQGPEPAGRPRCRIKA